MLTNSWPRIRQLAPPTVGLLRCASNLAGKYRWSLQPSCRGIALLTPSLPPGFPHRDGAALLSVPAAHRDSVLVHRPISNEIGMPSCRIERAVPRPMALSSYSASGTAVPSYLWLCPSLHPTH